MLATAVFIVGLVILPLTVRLFAPPPAGKQS